jgi:hypothetical protein
MTDLMCPARLACLHPGTGDPSGAPAEGPSGAPVVNPADRPWGALVAELRAARVVRVYAGPAVATEAVALAEALGVGHEVLAGLDGCGEAPLDAWLLDGELELPAGDGETGDAVLGRVAAALAGIADQHRGQAVAVISPAGPLALALAALCTGLSPATAHGHPLAPWTAVHIEYDSAGWHHLAGWPTVPPAPEPAGTSVPAASEAAGTSGPTAPGPAGTSASTASVSRWGA